MKPENSLRPSKAVWVLETDVFLEGAIERLADALVTAGHDFYWAEYAPLGASMSRPKHYKDRGKFLADDDCVVTYGSINLVRRLLQKNPWGKSVWSPTAWMTLKNLECRTYYSMWRKHMLVKENAFVTWAMLAHDPAYYYDKFGVRTGPGPLDADLFVKPNENLKLFTGKVVPRDGFKKFYDMETLCYDVAPETLCVVARPYHLAAEWRFVVCEGEVITGSQYRKDGRPCEEAGFDIGALEAAQRVAKDPWQPEPAYVVDIAKSGDEWGLLEIGSFNSAGLYMCDCEPIVRAISSLAEKEHDSLEDQPSPDTAPSQGDQADPQRP